MDTTQTELIAQNPLRLMGYDNDEGLAAGCFGAVCARAGVGKTALLVQLAMNALLAGRNVLHISLNDPVEKVNLWYEEVFSSIFSGFDPRQSEKLRQDMLSHRFIMTFKLDGFSVTKLIQRLTDLISQGIFTPRMVIIDGFPFDRSDKQSLADLKTMAGKHSMHIWFTLRTHRHEPAEPGKMPPPLSLFEDLFAIVLQLRPEGQPIYVDCLKGAPASTTSESLLLDPTTLILKALR